MIRIAIVGAGPAGFYTAQNLLKIPSVKVTMFEKRLVPFGLIRYGVAPDHPEIKKVCEKFESIAKEKNFSYFGNADIGNHVKIKQLQESYHAVVIATGSSSFKKLGIPGENTKNVLAGRDFVSWYNADPEFHCINPDLESTETAVILGQGNVALDCARILLSPIESLEKTDISDKALDVLRNSNVKRVLVVGRRGILQASFTAKEVREMMVLPGVGFNLDPQIEAAKDQHSDFLRKSRPKKRIVEILMKGSENVSPQKSWELKFLSSPTGIIEKNGKIVGLELEKNELIESSNPAAANVRGTGLKFNIECQLLIKCIGYKNVPFEGVPFDNTASVIPNIMGRVLDHDKTILGLYAAGWIKTGAVGVLTSTLFDANSTAQSLIEDIPKFSNEKRGDSDFLQIAKKYNWTTFDDWLQIDSLERKLGKKKGNARQKLATTNDLLHAFKNPSK